jgi:hypothetical protein
MLHQGFHHEGINNWILQGMKCSPTQLMRLSYYAKLKKSHLFDTIHIEKNVTKTLWRIIDDRRDKKKNSTIFTNIQKVNPAMKSVI